MYEFKAVPSILRFPLQIKKSNGEWLPPIKLVFNYFRVLAQLGLIYPLASFQPWAPARIERYLEIAKFLKLFCSLLWCDFLETDFWEDIYYSFYFVRFMVESSNVKIQWTRIKEPVAFLYTHRMAMTWYLYSGLVTYIY